MNIQEARKRLPELAGLSDESALNVIHEVYYPTMDKAELGSKLGVKAPVAATPERSTLRAMGDTAIHFGRGAVSGVRMMTDLAGADNKVSAGLRSADQAMGELLSATAKQDQQRIAEIMQEAEGKGWGEQIVAGLKAAGVAPGALMAQAAGTTLPTLAVAAIPGAGPAAAAARLGTAGAIGAGQGAGNIKGQIYETTKAELLKAGASPEEAEARAVQAQSYEGPNKGQIALGGALGAAAGSTGAERAVHALRSGVTKTQAGLVGRVVQGGLAEAVPEALQGGQEKFATNTALNNEGFQRDPWSGVVAQAAMEGVAGFGMGAATGLPAPRVHAEAIRATEKVPESGPLSRAANAGVEARAQAVEATGVDPTQPPQEQTQQPEPVDDPVVDRIKALPANKRSEALRAYAVLNRDGLAKGIVQYNRKLLDRLLAENEGADKTDPAPEPSGPLLLGYDQTPTGVMLAGPDGIRPEGRADVVNREQELGRQRDLGLTPDVLRAPRSQATPEPSPQMAAPEVVEPPATNVGDAQESAPPTSTPQTMGAFATPQEAEAYISAQRRSGGSRFQALPLPMEDGSFGVTTAESPEFGRAQEFRVKQERQAAGILEGDTLNKLGQPFKTKASAVLAAKKIGGDAVPVKGGFVVRKATPQFEPPQDAIDTPPAPAMAAAEPEATAPVVDSMAAPAADAQPEPVAALNPPQDADVTNTEAQPAAQAEAAPDQAPAAGAVSPAAEPSDVPGAGSSPLEAAGVEALQAAEAETDAIDQRIGDAEAAGVLLSESDKDKIRAAITKAEDLARQANRKSVANSDPMRKGNAFPLGVGFTRMTKRASQRIDASVRRAAEYVKAFNKADQAQKYADELLAGKGTDADAARKAKVKADTQRLLIGKLLDWKKGDKIGVMTIERVNKSVDGYPASYTISGDGVIKGVTDKVNVAREFFGGDAAAFRKLVDDMRANRLSASADSPPQPKPETQTEPSEDQTPANQDGTAAAPEPEPKADLVPERKPASKPRTKFSRQPTSADEQALSYISQQSDVFSLPKSTAKDIKTIVQENFPELTIKEVKDWPGRTGYKFTFPTGRSGTMSVRPANPYGPSVYGWDLNEGEAGQIITERPGENAEEMDGKADVWIDVSNLKSGEFGQVVYNIAATYAHNNGMVFIGDPNGLSDEALRRRTENMLNSALKFGTTEHLGPHKRQVDGEPELGVPPLRWVYGDHVGNIERMIAVSVKSAQNADYVQPAADYAPASAPSQDSEGRGRFIDGDGLEVGQGEFRASADFRENRISGIGGRTLARLAVFESLLRRAGESGIGSGGATGGNGILAQFAGIVRDFASAAKDDRIFYSRGDSSSGLTTDAAQAAVDSITSRWANAPEIVVVPDMQDSRVPEQARLDNDTQKSLDADGDPEAFYLDGKVYVVAGALKSEADVARVVFHEVLGHAGLRGVFGDKLNPILNQIAALRGAEIQAKAKQYGIDASTKEGRLDAAEEVLAEMAQTRPELGFVRRAVAAIRSWLRANVPGFAKLKLTDAEIVLDYLLPARGFIERGRAAAGEAPTVAGSGTATRYSRSLSTAFSDGLNNVRDLNLPAGYKVNDLFQSKGKLHWWHKTVGTQYNLAQRSPEFKPVFDTAQNFINDVAFYASTAADEAPTILPKLEDLRDIAKNPLSAADNKAIAAPIFEGTLVWTRDSDGKPVKADPASDAPVGIVFTPDELRSLFGLTDEQVSLYQEFRAAVDMSLASMAAADMVRFGGKDLEAVRDQMLAADSLDDATQVAAMHLETLAAADAGRATVLRDTVERLQQKADAAKDLMARGYAPLSRYGQHSLDVVDASGERVYFGLFESRAEANKMARQMRDNFPDAAVSQGTMSQEEYKLFSGVSPETVELFGDMLGLEATGDGESDQAFQQYLKLAKANRSAMKRLIHRKGIAGFSEDPGRVLAGFVYSNARQTSNSLHMGQLTEAVAAVPKGQGELKDAAIKLRDYVQNPQEEAQAFRGLLFAQYLGGSIASAIVNTTQPFAVTFPWLSQYGGIAKAAGQMRRATADALKKSTGDTDLDAALKDAEESGIVSPQEVFQLQAQAAGRAPLRAGDGTVAGNAMATASNALSKFSLAWGKLFGVAEQFNRRTTFIAAYRTAVEQGMDDPAAFAEKAIYETQFIYSKANNPRWARGAIGGTLFAFKQYSVNYLELLHRMATQGGPEGKRAALLALGVLFLLSGAGGLPFAEDIDDLIDGALQRMGYNFSSKQAKQEFFTNIFGQAGAQFVMRGVSGLAGVPIDISGRMGMQNLVPGTGALLKKDDRTRDLMELAGPAGDFAKRIAESGEKLMAGEVLGPRGAVATVLPLAMRNVAKAHEMATTGMYLDTKGKKVLDADGFDAAAKAIGFQPNDVARVQDATFEVQRRIGLNKMRESEIAGKWAKGVFLGDQDLVQEARADIKAWNDKNPEAPIRIQMPQITRRVREMRASKQDRIAKTAPQEIRDQVRRELAKELGQ